MAADLVRARCCEPTRRVIVCGTRDGLLDDAESLLLRRLHELRPCIVIEGGARGTDRLARHLAERLGLPVETFPADWKTRGKAAGPIRNQEMLDAGVDIVLAFPGPKSRGTWDMVRRAEKRGVIVEVHLT